MAAFKNAPSICFILPFMQQATYTLAATPASAANTLLHQTLSYKINIIYYWLYTQTKITWKKQNGDWLWFSEISAKQFYDVIMHINRILSGTVVNGSVGASRHEIILFHTHNHGLSLKIQIKCVCKCYGLILNKLLFYEAWIRYDLLAPEARICISSQWILKKDNRIGKWTATESILSAVIRRCGSIVAKN